MLNKVLLIGNVGKDPEVRNLESGAKTASFTLATSERFKDRSGETREMTEWHNIVAWRGLADLAENYIRKGSQIYVEGRIRTRSYERDGNTRYITEIQADNIQLLGRKSDNPATQNNNSSNYAHQNGYGNQGGHGGGQSAYGGAHGGYGQQQGGYAPAQQPAARPAQAPAPAPFVDGGDAGDDLPF